MISAVLRRMDVCRLTIEPQSPYLKDVTLCADHEGVRIRYRGNDILRNFDASRNEDFHGLVKWILREEYALRCCKSRRTHKHSNRLAELVDDSKYPTLFVASSTRTVSYTATSCQSISLQAATERPMSCVSLTLVERIHTSTSSRTSMFLREALST